MGKTRGEEDKIQMMERGREKEMDDILEAQSLYITYILSSKNSPIISPAQNLSCNCLTNSCRLRKKKNQGEETQAQNREVDSAHIMSRVRSRYRFSSPQSGVYHNVTAPLDVDIWHFDHWCNLK